MGDTDTSDSFPNERLPSLPNPMPLIDRSRLSMPEDRLVDEPQPTRLILRESKPSLELIARGSSGDQMHTSSTELPPMPELTELDAGVSISMPSLHALRAIG